LLSDVWPAAAELDCWTTDDADCPELDCWTAEDAGCPELALDGTDCTDSAGLEDDCCCDCETTLDRLLCAAAASLLLAASAAADDDDDGGGAGFCALELAAGSDVTGLTVMVEVSGAGRTGTGVVEGASLAAADVVVVVPLTNSRRRMCLGKFCAYRGTICVWRGKAGAGAACATEAAGVKARSASQSAKEDARTMLDGLDGGGVRMWY